MVELICEEIYYITYKSCLTDADNDKNKVTKGMMKIISLLALITIVFMFCIQNAAFTANDGRSSENTDYDVNVITLSHHAILDTDGKYHLYWLPETNSITFKIEHVLLFPFVPII